MAEATFSLDLHVLGPPLTFALSQDQTLQLNLQRRPKPALLTTIEHQCLLGNHNCWGIEGRSLRLPFELDLLFSFQRPTRKNPWGEAGLKSHRASGRAEFIQNGFWVNTFF